ncbi:type VI secretion system-associated FHA domain protein TagH [Larsenimonas suaedae]|uniref:Type VI secretion system-associated FHA domain protein TagH n=1 Tax=Larsenimonas suaedae TaxID=1851019 RepID=A0ABU1GXD4_9GAMM|nr:type VI secretion system-associated FHA domain protein TagH [Larsenimonas suaedae]MCM2973204.1 type VI secretion system-associated FHA domain protein TagH [Larsenimonas suaedae]MDR5896097.1 type VI secretion system-associated FHA domain protein TagH [Larsenimonas suaedae]
MKGKHPQYDLTLVVINSQLLEGGSTSSHVFGPEGGTLGSSPSDDWLLQDRERTIRPSHAQIKRVDGQFCLVDLSGHTFINNATSQIGRHRSVVLRDGDELSVGRYTLRVHHGNWSAEPPGSAPLSDLVDEETTQLTRDGDPIKATSRRAQDDPLDALGDVNPAASAEDPMLALNHRGGAETASSSESNGWLDDADDEWLRDAPSAMEDNQNRSEAAMGLPRIESGRASTSSTSTYSTQQPTYNRAEGAAMDDKLLHELEQTVGEQLHDHWSDQDAGRSRHIGADPLLRGLGAPLSFKDTEEQQRFLHEAGATLRSLVEGMLELNASQGDGRYSLRDRRLQPIEDNPLRLGQGYEQTIHTLFSAERSPVHLSAPAAVRESLDQQRRHQQAVEDAIGQALGAILDAFSPDALLKRFHAYRRSDMTPAEESAWAWDMYQHYYRELTSNRQQGFEKLFWEVFEQGYDRSVRELQKDAGQRGESS